MCLRQRAPEPRPTREERPMNALARFVLATVVLTAIALPGRAGAQSFVLDATSASLAAIPASPAELLTPSGPPLNDNIKAFDWAYPGKWYLSCVGFSLVPGSFTLTGLNPLLPAGAEPGDILVSCPGPPGSPPALFVFATAAALGLV